MQDMKEDKIIYPDLSYKICGLCFAVHNERGRYLSEKSYADALENTLKKNNFSYNREIAIEPAFDGENTRRNIPDFIIEDKIVLDIKAKKLITKDDYFQMKRYLISSGKRLGIIVNFRQHYLSPKRILN